jgi:hypothetical protein
MIRYWGDARALSVPSEALSLPPLSGAARARRHTAAADEPITRDRDR